MVLTPEEPVPPSLFRGLLRGFQKQQTLLKPFGPSLPVTHFLRELLYSIDKG